MTAVRSTLGGVIALDPFSSPEANDRVKAKRFFTEADDAFTQDWAKAVTQGVRRLKHPRRTCWMNPPYSGALCSSAVFRFVAEYRDNKAFDAGIFLVNNATETKWFQEALTVASGLCLTNHRIAFWKADNKAVSGNTRGQAFVYFGDAFTQFREDFSSFGAVIPLNTRRA